MEVTVREKPVPAVRHSRVDRSGSSPTGSEVVRRRRCLVDGNPGSIRCAAPTVVDLTLAVTVRAILVNDPLVLAGAVRIVRRDDDKDPTIGRTEVALMERLPLYWL